jgi:hypothetical protein
MRFPFVSLLLVAALALMVAGCGKTSEQRKMEHDLNAEVTALRGEVESNLAIFTELQTTLDETLKMHKQLLKKYAKKMKGHTADDIGVVKQSLDTAKNEANTVLMALKAYDEKMDHDQAMARLNQDKESLAKIMGVVTGAANAANTVIANHEKVKSGLTAKAPAKASAKTAAPKKTRIRKALENRNHATSSLASA